MPISLKCPNGHPLKAREALAGSRLPCPACGEFVEVPQLSEASSVAPLPQEAVTRRTVTTPTSILFRLMVRITRGIGLALLLLVVLWFLFARQSGQREATEKIQRIGYAFQSFHDKNRMFAPLRSRDLSVINPDLRPRPTELSWRVHLLPYLEQTALHEQFHFDEPWDSPHNLKLAELMPEVYRLGRDKGANTRFQVLSGPGMLFGNAQPARYRDVSDGSRNTILALAVGPDRATLWTKPDELVINPEDPLACLGRITGRYISTVAVDGRPLILPADIEPAKFLALTTPAGKEIIDGDVYRREFNDSVWVLLPNLWRHLTGQ